MPLKEVYCDFRRERDAEILRSITTLGRINGKPAAEFWKEVGLLGSEKGDGARSPATVADKDGFMPLFNGKDLTGWFVDGGDKQAWQVNRGELVARGTQNDRYFTQGYLLTERAYSDFILRFQFQQVGRRDATSGVALRAVPGETARNYSIREPNNWPFHLTVFLGDHATYEPYENGGLWWSPNSDLQPVRQPDRVAELKQIGEWNETEVEMRGQSLRCSVNGRDVQSVALNQHAPFLINPAIGLNRFSGRIGFLKRTGEVRFRNIEIKELPRTPRDK
jgi:hypothetical protein